jgi:histone deacetylase complex regulatory component SIN3
MFTAKVVKVLEQHAPDLLEEFTKTLPSVGFVQALVELAKEGYLSEEKAKAACEDLADWYLEPRRKAE